MTGRRPAVRPLPPAALVAIAALAAGAASLGNGFAYDDLPLIVDDPRVHHWSGLADVLTRPFWRHGEQGAMWRPVAAAAFTAQWVLGGGSALLFHLISVVLSMAVAVTAHDVFRRLLAPGPALAAGLLFAVLPVHVEVTANAIGQAELLCTLFALLALRCWLDDAPPAPLSRVQLGATCALAAASKEQGLIVPLLLLAMEAARPDGPRSRAEVRQRLAPALLGAGAAFVVRTLVLGGLGQGEPIPAIAGLGLAERVTVMLALVPTMLRVLLLPDRLLADYNPTDVPWSPGFGGDAALGGLAVAGVVALAATGPDRRRTLALLAGALLAFGPAANVLAPTGVLFAERHLFLPTVPLAAFAALRWSASAGRRHAGPFLLAVLVPLGIWRSAVRAPEWRDTPTLLAALRRDAPRNYRGLMLAAREAVAAGQPDSAEVLLRRALVLFDRDARVHEDLGQLLRRRDGCAAALALFQRAVALQPSRLTARVRADECARQLTGRPSTVRTDPIAVDKAPPALRDTAPRDTAVVAPLSTSTDSLALPGPTR